MKIIIEQKDVGKEIEIGDFLTYLNQAMMPDKLQGGMKSPHAIVYDADSFGFTPAGAKVTAKESKQRKKPGPKPKKKSNSHQNTTTLQEIFQPNQ